MKDYLPYVSPASDGNFKTNEIGEQYIFNSAQFPGEQSFYSNTTVESSPLERPLATYAPGNSWSGSGRGTFIQYQFNQISDSIRLWDIDFPQGSVPVSTAFYAPGMLNKKVTQDEAGHIVVDYTDKQGHTILKKVQLSDTPAPGHSGWLCTYYVYVICPASAL